MQKSSLFKSIISSSRILILAFVLLISQNVFGGWVNTAPERMAAVYNPANPTVPSSKVTVSTGTANKTISNLPPGGTFNDIEISNKIEFGIDVHYPQYLTTATSCTITLTIDKYDALGTTILSTETGKTLSITYDPTASTAKQDKAVYVFSGYYKFKVTITGITVNSAPVNDLPFNMYVDMFLDINRVNDFTATASTPPSLTVSTIDLDANLIPDELSINWPTVTGAEEYQLEWTFVNNYGITTATSDDVPATSLTYSFKNNSTRITTVSNSYQIPILFDRGYVIFRLRAIGKKTTSPYENIIGVWSSAAETGLVSSTSTSHRAKIEDTWVHENDKNWQVSTTFAEEGKKKEVINYFDGSMRSRQTVTRVNTDENVIVGETIYDYQGRPAISVLPVPVEKTAGQEKPLQYFEGFNKDISGGEYTAYDFDRDATPGSCTIAAAKMSSSYGASKYHSSNNNDKTNEQAFVPDAKEFPFAQVEYTPDNTNRIKRKGGVGEEFQLGSGHEMKYFYGQPNQEQLDRLFGSEVGDAAHYKKNMLIDQNGQIHVSYLDQEGRVVATALAGDNPATLQALPSQTGAAITQTIDLFSKDANGFSQLNQKNIAADAITFNTQYMVTSAGNHTFSYSIDMAPYDEVCLATGICFNCIYDLELSIKDECGDAITGFPITTVVGNFSLDGLGNLVFNTTCAGNAAYSHTTSPAIFLNVGTYTVSKKLTVNQKAVDYYVQQYLNKDVNTCALDLEDFQEDYLNAIDFSNCAIDCDECIAALGDRDEFVSSGKGTALDYDYQIENCKKMCKKMPSDCEVSFEQMKMDMSPGGQYGEYLDALGNITPGGFPLSVFNSSNSLPAHILLASSGYWKYPKTTLNGVTYLDYVNSDGSVGRATINVTTDPVSGLPEYFPAVADPTQITTDASGNATTPLTNLLNVSDFITTYWRPEYALALVCYHPEYLYYQTCAEYGKVQSGHTISSDEYDETMMAATTFAQANSGTASKDFINSSNVPFDPSVVVTTNIYDPWLATISSTYSTLFMSKWNNYINVSGAKKMYEYAAITARCGTPYTTFISTCDDFGMGSTTAILDAEWNAYKTFYRQLKNEIKQKIADDAALATTTTYGCNDCIGNLDDFNPYVSKMLLFTPGSLSAFFASTVPYFNSKQPCSIGKKALYANKVQRFPDPQVIPGYSSSTNTTALGQEAAYQVYLQTGQCPKAHALQYIFDEIAAANKINAASEPLTGYPSFNSYYMVINNYNTTVPITTGANYNWITTVLSTHVLKIEWKDAGSILKQTFTITKPSTVAAWSNIVSFSNLEATSSTAFTIEGKLNTGDYVTITGTTDLDMFNCNFAETCEPNQFALDLQELMSALAINGHLTSSTAYNLSTNYPLLLTSVLKTELGMPYSNVTWKYTSGTKIFTLQDASAASQRIEFKILDPASPVFTSVKYYAGINSNGYNIFTMNGYDATGTLIHTLRLSAVKYSPTGVKSNTYMGNCGLPESLLCVGDEYAVSADLKLFLEEEIVTAAKIVPYPTTIDITASRYLSSMIISHIPLLSGNPINLDYTRDPTGPNYNDTLILEIPGSPILLRLNTTNNIHLNDSLITVEKFITTYSDFMGGLSTFKLVAKFAGGTTDTIYGTTKITIDDCDPCGEETGTAPTPVFSNTTLECNTQYTNYTNAVTAFNAVAGSLGLSTITPVASGYFNYNSYCGCVDTYISLLQSIMSGASPGTGTNYNNLNNHCLLVLQVPCIPESNNIPDTLSFPTLVNDTTGCELQLIQQAYANAQQAYDQYVQEQTTIIANAYKTHCLNALETFTSNYTDKEYHFTLFYYDQAGSMIKSIPPEGVEPLNLAALYNGGPSTVGTIIKQDRAANGTRRVYTYHRLANTYEYNSRSELVKQSLPDHDPMDIWSPALTSGLDTNLTITKVQFFNDNKGFLTGYIPGNLGVLYTTNDGGYTWKRVEDVVGTTINKVHMVNTSTGYAVGNKGVILRTTNGGSTWEMLNTYAANVSEDIIDVVFEDANKGVAILKSNSPVVLGITNGTTTPVFTKFIVSLVMTGSGGYASLTGITYNPNTVPARYIAVGKFKFATGSPETGLIYHQDAAAVTTTSWIGNGTINPSDLNKITYNSTLAKYYSGGVTGQLQQITTAINSDQATNVTGNIIDLYFATLNDGIAIIEDVVNQGQIYRTSDAGLNWTLLSNSGDYYKSLSFYEKVTDASGDLYKFVAVGLNNRVRRVILQVNNPGGIVDMTEPGGTPTQLNSVWSFKHSGKVHIVTGGNSGKIYYCNDASAVTPVWYTQTLAIGSENVLKIAGFVDGLTGDVAINILTQTGGTYKIYKAFKLSTSTNFGSLTSVTLPGGAVINDISSSEISSTVRFNYFYNNTDRLLYKIPLTINSSGNAATALTNAIPAYTGTLLSLSTTVGTDLMLVGTNGLLYKGILNSTTAPTSVTWTNMTNNLQTLALTDVQKAPTSGGYVYATSWNGDVYENYSATSWRKLKIKCTDRINAITFSTSVDGLMAANSGKLYQFFINPGIDVTLTSLNTSSTANFMDVAINGTVAAAVADNGLILVNDNYPSDNFVPTVNQSVVPLYGLSTRPSSSEIICVGSNSQIRKIAGNTVTKIQQVFTPNLNSVHFYNSQEGYLVGDWLTARHTTDGGTTWQVAVPSVGWSYTSTTLPNLRGVFTSGLNSSTIVGNQGKVYTVATNTLTSVSTGATSTYVFNDVEKTGTNTFVVGNNGSGNKAMYMHNGSTWSAITLPVATGTLNGIHTFARNNSFMVVGNSGATTPVIYYGRTTVLTTSSPVVSSSLNDVHFIDDVNGYTVGTNGTILKSKNFAYSAGGTMDYTTIDWYTGLSAGPLSGQTNTSLMNILTVSAINHTTVISGGTYNANRVYARLTTDESLRYSVKYWYDKLGRVVLSQNTRQFNQSPKVYSYTLYDALGRSIEAGEKSENTSGNPQFSSIFGSTVNTHWNPTTIDDAKLLTWINHTSGARNEVIRNYYDKVETAIASTLPGSFIQEELRQRISCVAYYPSYSTSTATTAYDHATHFSYDIDGNANSVLQENRKLAIGSGAGTNVTDERYNRIDYFYDLVSGNVNKVSYETGKADQWHMSYAYDADNRMTQVKTSDNNVIWDKDAAYFYYADGPLARTELGQNKVQALDFAYTIYGWLKGVNSNDLNSKRDIGQDGFIASSNPNQIFASDAVGYTLNYFNGDYKPIDQTNKWNTVTDRFEADKTSSNIDISTNGLYNGCIRSSITTITNPSTYAVLPQAMLYGYDQINRLKDAKAFANLNTTTNVWGNTTYAGSYENNFTYDGNGNILSQVRKNQAGTGTIENMTYNYYNSSGKTLKNRLYHIDDATSSGTYTDDIDDMGTFDNTTTYNTGNNYTYDAEGRLTKDTQEEIASIKYRANGKVSEVIRTVGSTKKALRFDYDAAGQRVAKHQYNNIGTTWEKSTYYVRDGSGNVIATYEKVNPGTASMKVKERSIIGTSRHGIYKKEVEMISSPTPSTSDFTHETGIRNYELCNQLGNVLAVITDRKRPLDDGDHDNDNNGINESSAILGAADNQTDYYRVEFVVCVDYYPFGVPMTGRDFTSENYRYGFNNMERDEEMKGKGNSVNFEYRMHDPRIGRFFTVDKASAVYPHRSPFNFAANNPVTLMEVLGLGTGDPTKANFLLSLHADATEQLQDDKGTNWILIPIKNISEATDAINNYCASHNCVPQNVALVHHGHNYGTIDVTVDGVTESKPIRLGMLWYEKFNEIKSQVNGGGDVSPENYEEQMTEALEKIGYPEESIKGLLGLDKLLSTISPGGTFISIACQEGDNTSINELAAMSGGKINIYMNRNNSTLVHGTQNNSKAPGAKQPNSGYYGSLLNRVLSGPLDQACEDGGTTCQDHSDPLGWMKYDATTGLCEPTNKDLMLNSYGKPFEEISFAYQTKVIVEQLSSKTYKAFHIKNWGAEDYSKWFAKASKTYVRW